MFGRVRAARWTVGPLVMVAACEFYPDEGTDPVVEETDVTIVDQCTPAYIIPGTQGLPATARTPDPHEAVLGEAPTPTAVHLGWPGSDPSKSVSVVWSTDLQTLASQVELGPVDGETTIYNGVSFTYGGTSHADHRVHEWKTCDGLVPGTTYTYRVGGEGAWSPWYTFTTPLPPGSFDTFTVAIAGDSRGSYEQWGEIVAAMASHGPDFILMSGDMVEFGTNQHEWEAWFEGAGEVLAEIPLIPAHGNHEFLATNYFSLFSLPHTEQWFSFDYGTLTGVVLNDSFVSAEVMDQTEGAFIDEVFTDSASIWRVAMHHRPAYTIGTTHSSDTNLRSIWSPRFDTHGVDLVINGHNHLYERSVPIRAEQEVAVGQGTTYLVSGGAGAPLYTEVEDQWFNEVSNPIEHYIIAEFGPDSAEFTVRDLEGTVIDSFTVPKN